MAAARKPGPVGRIGLALFLAVFVLGFGAVGLFIGIGPLWQMLKEAPRLQHYVPVPAQVLEARMSHDSDRKAYLIARYQYPFAGRTLMGDRIAWSLSRPEQRQWHERLAAAQAAGQTVTAWIDPEHPGMALLDRKLRWQNIAFLLPFALVFPAVSIGALIGLVAVLRGDRSKAGVSPSRPAGASSRILRDNSRQKAWGLTVFTLLWNLVAFPIALVAWGEHQGWGLLDTFVAFFPAVGVLMAWASVQTWREALYHRGSSLTLDTSGLHVGEPTALTVHLPAARWTHAGSADWKARLVQSRLPHDDSERKEETVSEQALPLRGQPSIDGGGSLRVQLHWPQGACPSGVDTEGHRTTWRLILEEAGRSGAQVFELPVQAGRPGFVDTMGTSQAIPQPAAFAEPVPASVMSLSRENGMALARFARPWRNSGVLGCALLAAGLAFVSRQHFNAADAENAAVWLLSLLASVLAIALALHIGSRRWVLGITRDAWWLDRSSALWRHHIWLSTDQSSPLEPRLTHTHQMHGQAAGYHRLEQKDARTQRRQPITPPLPGLGVALGAAQQLQALRQQAAMSADMATAPSFGTATVRARWSALAAWLLLSLLSLAFATHLDTAASLTLPDTARSWLTPVHRQLNTLLGIGQADQALLAAIDQADEQAVRKALGNGANPSATSDSGRSALMLAAGRGLQPIVDALLQHGADVNYADQTSVNERGDTALLMAAYFGHPAAFEKLLAAGARTDVVNRWDWTPVHMAAMGDCLPCLETLRQRGLSLDARATASRGESPLQVAAAKGRLAAMQWLLEHGADASQRDDHGQDVFAWARFFKRGDSERWLRERLPAAGQRGQTQAP
jgi:ankyrin repeat protein